jgi:hypothetical protein
MSGFDSDAVTRLAEQANIFKQKTLKRAEISRVTIKRGGSDPELTGNQVMPIVACASMASGDAAIQTARHYLDLAIQFQGQQAA